MGTRRFSLPYNIKWDWEEWREREEGGRGEEGGREGSGEREGRGGGGKKRK